jgi:hypothetical protein
LPAFGEQSGDESRKTSDLAAEYPGKSLRRELVGAHVDKDASGSPNLSGPQITLPSSNPDKAQIIEFDVAVVAFPDVPEKDRLARAVIGGVARKCRGRRGRSYNCRTSLLRCASPEFQSFALWWIAPVCS